MSRFEVDVEYKTRWHFAVEAENDADARDQATHLMDERASDPDASDLTVTAQRGVA